jgi:hypothetical protein
MSQESHYTPASRGFFSGAWGPRRSSARSLIPKLLDVLAALGFLERAEWDDHVQTYALATHRRFSYVEPRFSVRPTL